MADAPYRQTTKNWGNGVNNMEFSDLLVILLITAGATKAAAFFVAQARDMSRPEKLTVVTRALAIMIVTTIIVTTLILWLVHRGRSRSGA